MLILDNEIEGKMQDEVLPRKTTAKINTRSKYMKLLVFNYKQCYS